MDTNEPLAHVKYYSKMLNETLIDIDPVASKLWHIPVQPSIEDLIELRNSLTSILVAARGIAANVEHIETPKTRRRFWNRK